MPGNKILSDLPSSTLPPLVALSSSVVQVYTGFIQDESTEETEIQQNSFTVVVKEDRPRVAFGYITAVHGSQAITVFGMANVAVIESDEERQGKVFEEEEIQAKFLDSPAHKTLYSTIRTGILTVSGLIDHEMLLPEVAPIEDCEVEILYAKEEDDDSSSDR